MVHVSFIFLYTWALSRLLAPVHKYSLMTTTCCLRSRKLESFLSVHECLRAALARAFSVFSWKVTLLLSLVLRVAYVYRTSVSLDESVSEQVR